MTDKHTLLPWVTSRVIGMDGMFFIYIKTEATYKNWLKNDTQRIIARVEGIAEEQTEGETIATAELIVRAVNNHDALVEALDEMVSAVKAILNNMINNKDFTVELTKSILPADFDGCGVRAQQTLAKAKGES